MRPFLTLHNPSQAKAYYEAGLWASDTFFSLLLQHASARPDAFALRDGRQRLTWEELLGFSWIQSSASLQFPPEAITT